MAKILHIQVNGIASGAGFFFYIKDYQELIQITSNSWLLLNLLWQKLDLL